MIKNHWYPILESKEVKKGQVIGTTRLGEKIAVWRKSDGQVSIVRDRCPHRSAKLSAGKVVDDTIMCPFHGFRYDETGRCVLIPANGKAAPIPKVFQADAQVVDEAAGFIWWWWGDKQESYPPLPMFENLDDSFSYGTAKQHWPVHYSRIIENQLDVSHVPFIHHRTIGRGAGTIVVGPISNFEDGQLNVWTANQLDDGKSVAPKPGDLPAPQTPPRLRFRYPNIWQNWLNDRGSIFIAFVPIDEENTVLYLRFYQKFMQFPGIDWLITRIGSLANLVVAGEDRRVVVTQQPKRADIGIGEAFISADQPLLTYLRERRNRQRASET